MTVDRGPRVLIVEDEPEMRRSMRRFLTAHGYDVREAADGAEARREFPAFKPDVVLLDLMLPDTSGVELCREVRAASDVPVIVLSALEDEKTKVQALDEGADDYVTKPFSVDELLARLRVALRRGSASRSSQAAIEVAGLRLDLEKRQVSRAGQPVHLTPTEYSLLKFLAVNAGKALTHPMILRAVWGPEYASDSHLLRTFVNQLRGKIEDDPARPRLILTDPGVGYRFSDPDTIS